MTEPITVMGVVVSAMPVGEYDKRLVIITKERGKITVFARGARKPNSNLLAASNPFVFAKFTMYEGRTSYSLMQVSVVHHFIELAALLPEVYYAFYFLEFAEYYASENSDETNLVNLLYVALRALQNEKMENELIRYIFEIRMMMINGEFAIEESMGYDESTLYTLQYIMGSPVTKLFSFVVSDEVLFNLRKTSKVYQQRFVEKRFKSLEILEGILR